MSGLPTPSGRSDVAQRDAARLIANQRRTARKQLHEDIINGHAHVADLLETVPPVVHGMTVLDVMMLARRINKASSTLARIGRAAANDRINLLQPVEKASERTRGWAARNTPPVRRAPLRQAA
jgi:hypothetical protein